MFEKNVGPLDRIMRVGGGAALMALALSTPGAWLAWIGVVPFITGLTGRCPIYSLLHRDSLEAL